MNIVNSWWETYSKASWFNLAGKHIEKEILLKIRIQFEGALDM